MLNEMTLVKLVAKRHNSSTVEDAFQRLQVLPKEAFVLRAGHGVASAQLDVIHKGFQICVKIIYISVS